MTLFPHTFIIAEVAQAHDGSLGTAHAYIDAAARAGADAVKFQTHIADAESSPDEPWRVKFSPQDATRYDYWKRMEFTAEQWSGLKTHADEKGITFLSSPFSIEAAELLEKLGMAMWKIASGEITNVPMIDFILSTGKPVLLSTGMSPWDEIDAAVERIRAVHDQFVLMQCTTEYPCPPERIGLNVLDEFRTRYGCGAGLSDHSGTIYPGLAASTLGADVIEVHITFSKESFGPDVPASLTPEGLRTLVDGVRFIDAMRAHAVSKEYEATLAVTLRDTFMKGIVARVNIRRGTVLGPSQLCVVKPLIGVPAYEWSNVLGCTAARNIHAGAPLVSDDLIGFHSKKDNYEK